MTASRTGPRSRYPKGKARPLSIGKEAGRLNELTEATICIEGQSDELHDKGRRELFLSETNAIAFMIGSEVYDHLEQVVDRFEDVANEISAIVIENV